MDAAALKIFDVEFNSVNGGSFSITVMHANSSRSSGKTNEAKINQILDKEKLMATNP